MDDLTNIIGQNVTTGYELNNDNIKNFTQWAQNDYNVLVANGISESDALNILKSRYDTATNTGITLPTAITETHTADTNDLVGLLDVKASGVSNPQASATADYDAYIKLGLSTSDAEALIKSRYSNYSIDTDQIFSSGSTSTSAGGTSNYNDYWGNISGTATEIDYDAAIDACTNWEKGNNFLDNAFGTMNSNPFTAMTNFTVPIGKAYVDELKNSIEELMFESKKMQNASKSYAETTKASEEGGTTWPEGGDTGYTNYTGGSSGGGGGGGTPTSPTSPTSPDPTTPIDPSDTTIFNDLDFNTLNSLIESLKDINKDKGLDEILLDDTYADDIKKILLESTYISDDLKKVLETMDSKVIRQVLQSVMKGEVADVFELNEANLGMSYQYLAFIAEKNGITIDQLLTATEHTVLLKETLSGFSVVAGELKTWETLSAEEYQSNLLKIYDGDSVGEMSETSLNIMRTFSEYLSTASGIATESLLTETKYAETLQSGVQDFAKTALLLGASSEYSDSGMTETISTVFKDVK